MVLAAKLAARACENGGNDERTAATSKWGCQILSRVYENHPAFSTDLKKVTELLAVQKDFCKRGVMVACRNVGFAIEHGVGWPNDDVAALRVYTSACVNGFAPACVDARALRMLSPNSTASDAPRDLVPTASVPASEKIWSADHVSNAMAALEECDAGNHDGCVAASQYYFSNDYAAGRCERPPHHDELVSFPDPERALRIASHDCPENTGSKCAVAKREIAERGLAQNFREPNLPLCDYRDRASYDRALDDACMHGVGKACRLCAAELSRPGRHSISSDREQRLAFYSRGCDEGDSGSCDDLASELEGAPDVDKKRIDQLRDRACTLVKPGESMCTRQAHEHDPYFQKPTFLSFGAIASFANPDARATIGGELTVVRWLDDEPGGFAFGGYAQGEYVAGNTGRTSFGLQGDFSGFGVELGYAYQRLLEDKLNQSSLQVTPFISIGIAHIGFRALVPITPSGAPVGMLVVGLKVPIDIGKDVQLGPRHPFFD